MTITSPRFGATKTDATVEIVVEVSKSFELSTLVARLNGDDISEKLSLERCKATVCTMKGAVTVDEGLREGSNHLVVSVSDKRHRHGAKDRTRFTYHDPMGAVTDTSVSYYTPASLGIEARSIFSRGFTFTPATPPQSSNWVDPLPSIPLSSKLGNTLSLSYPDTVLFADCVPAPYGAVTMDRKNPTVQKGSWCGSSVSDFEAQLKPGADDLVVFGTGLGQYASPGLDTSSLGGTDYSRVDSTLYPQGYILIGVMGAAPGTAHENYSVAPRTGEAQPPMVRGTLMLDGSDHYNYVPSGEADFAVISGAASSSAVVGSTSYESPDGASDQFWLLVLDRQTLQPIIYNVDESINMAVPCTPSPLPSRPMRCGNVFQTRFDGGAALAATLASISARNLIILSTVGCPFDENDQISSNLGNAIQKIGGMRYALNSLTEVADKCRYSLVSANDGQHQFLGSNAALSANQFGDQGQLGAIHGYLAVNKAGLYDVAGQDQMINGTKGVVGVVDYTFEHIASDFRSAWPLTSTQGELLAYHDISFQLLDDPQINITGEHMYDVRYFYTNPTTANKIAALIDLRLAPTATNPVTQSTWDTATAAEFSGARATILAELQQVQSATGYLTGSDNGGGVRGLLNGKDEHILADAFAVAGDISHDQAQAAQTIVSANNSDFLNLAAGIVSGFAAAEAVDDGPASAMLGLVSASLWTGSAAATPLGLQSSSIPGPETSYDVTLGSIVKDASTYVDNIVDGFDAAVDNVLSDPYKLSRVAQFTSDSGSSWQLPTEVSDLGSGFADGVRRAMWLDILPTLYGVRVAIAKDSSNPATFGSLVFNGPFKSCESVYSIGNSGVAGTSMTANSHIGDGQTFRWDVNILAEGVTVTYPANPLDVQDPAMSGTLSQLLTTSGEVDKLGDDSHSEMGLNIPPMVLINNGPFLYSPLAYFDNNPQDYCDARVGATGNPGADTPGQKPGGPTHGPHGPTDRPRVPDHNPRGAKGEPFPRDPGGRGPR